MLLVGSGIYATSSSPCFLAPSLPASYTSSMAETPQTVQPRRNDLRISPGPRMKAALALAILADIVQFFIPPAYIEGAAFPPDDIVDVCMAGILSWLLGWHWEFL